MSLKGSKTGANLNDAIAGASQATRRYLYFAAKADVEGHNDVAGQGAELSAGIDHPNCRVEIRPIAENVRNSLMGDLS